MASSASKPRRFAPLKAGAAASPGVPKLQGVVFDVDGTLCQPQNYMFGEMRAALGIPKSVDILDHIYSLPTQDAQAAAMEKIRDIERAAMARQVAQPGLAELMRYLDARGVRKGICTRNFDQPVRHLLSNFLSDHLFEPIVTRDFRPPKPDPAGILHIARSWGLTRRSRGGGEAGVPAHGAEQAHAASAPSSSSPSSALSDSTATGPGGTAAVAAADDGGEEDLVRTEEGEEVADASGLIMVGDSIDDMTAGRRAGAATVLLVNDANRHLAEHAHTDLVINRLDELVDILEEGFEGREVE